LAPALEPIRFQKKSHADAEAQRKPGRIGKETEKRLANLWDRKKIAKRPTLVVSQNPNGDPET
jgi:hypothetical protein